MPTPIQVPQVPTPPAPPAIAPVAPATGPVFNVPTTVEGLPSRPLTLAEVGALRARQGELGTQLVSASGRRNDLVRQLRRGDVLDRANVESRVAFLDQRILQLEKDLSETGRLLASPQAQYTTATTAPAFPPFRNSRSANPTAIGVVFTIFVLAPLALTASRILWRRASAPPAPRPSREHEARLERIEQAVDTIAIEIERISEGQRFMTRIMTERPGAARSAAAPEAVSEAAPEPPALRALGPGAMEELPVDKRQAVPIERVRA